MRVPTARRVSQQSNFKFFTAVPNPSMELAHFCAGLKSFNFARHRLHFFEATFTVTESICSFL